MKNGRLSTGSMKLLSKFKKIECKKALVTKGHGFLLRV
jgi:hypothetical protein